MEVIVTKLGDNTEIISRYFENNSIELWSNNKTINESIKRLLKGHKDVIIHDNKVELKGDKDSTMVSLAIELKLKSLYSSKILHDINENDPEYSDKMKFINFLSNL